MQGTRVLYGPNTEHIRVEVDAIEGNGGHTVESWEDALELAKTPRKIGPLPHIHQIDCLKGALKRQLDILVPFIDQLK